jgi:surface polysaccharide O-acyltransferase-like enzyme
MNNYLSLKLKAIAVPIFFTISGYLFFLGLKGSLPEFEKKRRKRVKTLVLPYLL